MSLRSAGRVARWLRSRDIVGASRCGKLPVRGTWANSVAAGCRMERCEHPIRLSPPPFVPISIRRRRPTTLSRRCVPTSKQPASAPLLRTTDRWPVVSCQGRRHHRLGGGRASRCVESASDRRCPHRQPEPPDQAAAGRVDARDRPARRRGVWRCTHQFLADRDLGLAGRVVVRSGDGLQVRLVETIGRCFAFHSWRFTSTASSDRVDSTPNRQRHMVPMWGPRRGACLSRVPRRSAFCSCRRGRLLGNDGARPLPLPGSPGSTTPSSFLPARNQLSWRPTARSSRLPAVLAMPSQCWRSSTTKRSAA